MTGHATLIPNNDPKTEHSEGGLERTDGLCLVDTPQDDRHQDHDGAQKDQLSVPQVGNSHHPETPVDEEEHHEDQADEDEDDGKDDDEHGSKIVIHLGILGNND